MPAPNRPPFPSAPSEPNLRRLGVTGRGSGADRPLRAQLVVASVVGLILLAVPLYLWRRPSVTEQRQGDAGAEYRPNSAVKAPSVPTADAAVPVEPSVRVDAPQRIRCSASPSAKGQEGTLCDSLPFFEKALADAIRKTTGCGPKSATPGTLNFVLQIDFRRKWLNVFPGASGDWKGPQARRATTCVERALAQPEWDKIVHQYSYYMVAIMATYPPPGPIPGPAGAPVFE